jgi:hypothetical protein
MRRASATLPRLTLALALLWAVPTWAFVPSDVPGLLLWLEADNIDGQRNVTLAPNQQVCVWQDLSGHNYLVSANSPPARGPITCPTYKTGVLNNALSAPALQFNGTSDAYTVGHQLDCALQNYPCGGPTVKFTAFVVVQEQNIVSGQVPASSVTLWSTADLYAIDSACYNVTYTGEGSGGYCRGFPCTFHQCSQGRGLTVATYPYLAPYGNGSLSIGTFDDLTNAEAGASALTFAADQAGDAFFYNTTRVVSYVFDQSQPTASIQRLWVDGSAQSGTSVHASGSQSRSRGGTGGTLEIGRWFYGPPGLTQDVDTIVPPFNLGVPASWFKGYYAAVVFFSGSAAPTARPTIEAYFRNKYEQSSGFTPLPGTATPAITTTPSPCPTKAIFSCVNGEASLQNGVCQ